MTTLKRKEIINYTEPFTVKANFSARYLQFMIWESFHILFIQKTKDFCFLDILIFNEQF